MPETWCGPMRRCSPTCTTRPASRAALTIARLSPTVWPVGFSTKTWAPAFSAVTVSSACQWSGAAMTTTSGFSRSSSSRKSWYFFGAWPVRSFTSSAEVSSARVSTSARATTFDRPAATASRRMFIPHQPQPSRAVRYLRPAWASTYGPRPRTRGAAPAAARNWRRFTVVVPRSLLLLRPHVHAHQFAVGAAAVDAPVGQDRRRPALAVQHVRPRRRPELLRRSRGDHQLAALAEDDELAGCGRQRPAADALVRPADVARLQLHALQ